MKKAIIVGVSFLAVATLVLSAAVCRRAHTPHGTLDYTAAATLLLYDLTKDPRPPSAKTIEEHRLSMERGTREMRGKPTPVASFRDIAIPGPGGAIPARVYLPVAGKGLPVLLYFHGGGWSVGSIATHEHIARALAVRSGAAVVSVGYRLAPEHPYPAAVDDAYASLVWASREAGTFGGDPARIAIAGDSAGGNLTAAVCLMARDRKGPRALRQVLICPAVDLSRLDTRSYRDYGRGYFLEKDLMVYFRGKYLPDEKRRTEPYASPLLAKDLAGLPPALVITAEFDVLRDEARAYADALARAGVPADHRMYRGMLHDFVVPFTVYRQGGEALDLIASTLKKDFANAGRKP